MDYLLSGSVVGFTGVVSQAYCSQSPCPRGRPLLIHASAGDTQIHKGRCSSVSCGVPESWCTQGFVGALWVSLAVMGLDSKHNFSPLTTFLGLLLGHELPFFGGIQYSTIDSFSMINCNYLLTPPTLCHKKKKCSLHNRVLKCKSKKLGDTWSNRQIWSWSTKWSRQRLTEICQENTLVVANTTSKNTRDNSTYGHHQLVNT